MKVILYLAITANSLIARENDATDWVSPIEWKNYAAMVAKAGNIIIGRRTYEVMLRNKEFSKLGKVKVVVVSTKLKINKKITVVKSPQEALTFLRRERFSLALVCGGGKLNSSFMKASLIDELYLDIEPIILGTGIKLFAEAEFDAKLELLRIKKLSKDEVQLQYKVKKLVYFHLL